MKEPNYYLPPDICDAINRLRVLMKAENDNAANVAKRIELRRKVFSYLLEYEEEKKVVIAETNDFVAFNTREDDINMIKIVGLRKNISFSLCVENFQIKLRFALQKKEGDEYKERTITKEQLDKEVGQDIMILINDWLHHYSEIYGRTAKSPWDDEWWRYDL